MPFNIMLRFLSLTRKSCGAKWKFSIQRIRQGNWKNLAPIERFHNEKKLFNKNLEIVERRCGFHVSSRRNALPPLLLLALRSLGKIGAIVSGRLIRKWWQRLTPEQKEKVRDYIRSEKSKIAGACTVFAGSVYLFYLSQIKEDPITKRKRFMMLNQKQLSQIADFECEQQLNMFEKHIVPSYHPLHRRVTKVTNTLLLSNRDIEEIRNRKWSVTVVDRPDITNACAYANGHIFVFTGMLNVCTNDDQLAVVLAHEISHSILAHVAESMSKVFLLEFLLLIPSIVFWSVFPDAWALFSDWIVSYLAKVLIHLPFSRSIEREADLIGLKLAAKSCYDVRQAPIFWKKMQAVSADAPVEWLSTHPRHESRQMELQELVPDALKIREYYKCPPLAFKLFY